MEKQIKFESEISKIYEVKQHLIKAKEDVEKALIQQDALITIIESSEMSDKINPEYLKTLKDDRVTLAAKALAFGDSITAADLIIYNYELEKKQNKKHSSLSTETVLTLAVNTFDIFRKIERGYLEKIKQIEKPAEESTEEPTNTPEA